MGWGDLGLHPALASHVPVRHLWPAPRAAAAGGSETPLPAPGPTQPAHPRPKPVGFLGAGARRSLVNPLFPSSYPLPPYPPPPRQTGVLELPPPPSQDGRSRWLRFAGLEPVTGRGCGHHGGADVQPS